MISPSRWAIILLISIKFFRKHEGMTASEYRSLCKVSIRKRNSDVMTSNQTKWTGLLGYPVEHSMSAVMQNAAYQALGLPYQYVSFPVPPNELKDAISGIKALGFRGVNVTIPHKVAVMELLDEVDDLARDIGAVNTISLDRGRLIGFNTDGTGYIQSLQEDCGIDVSGLNVLVLGAGGAARSVTAALARAGVGRLHIFDPRPDCSHSLAKQLALRVEAEAVTDTVMEKRGLADIDLLINATPVGMYPHVNHMPLAPSLLHPGLTVSDIIYNPYETALIKEAQKKSALMCIGA